MMNAYHYYHCQILKNQANNLNIKLFFYKVLLSNLSEI